MVGKSVVLITVIVAAILGNASSAAATVWTHEGETLGSAGIEMSGPVGFASAFEAYECEVQAAAFIEGEGGAVTSFEILPETCVGSGVLEGCKVIGYSITNLPWTLTLNAGWPPIWLNGSQIHLEFDVACVISRLSRVFSRIFGTPNDSEEISSLNLSGEGVTEILGLEIESEVYGQLGVSPSWTYGIS